MNAQRKLGRSGGAPSGGAPRPAGRRRAGFYLAGGLLAAALGLAAWRLAGPPDDWRAAAPADGAAQADGTVQAAATGQGLFERPPAAAAAAGDWSDPARRQSALQAVLAGRRSLLPLLEAVRRDCADRRDDARCRGWPDADLARLAPADAARLRRALTLKETVEHGLGALVQSTDRPLAERLAAVSAARRELAGADMARLLYGEEEARLGFQIAARDFAAGEAARLPQAERQARIEALRRQAYGDYYDTLAQAETPSERLYWAQLAAESGLPADQRAAVRQALRRDYLGAEMAGRLAAQDAADARHAAAMAGYRRDSAALLAEIRRRGEPERDAALAAELDGKSAALQAKWFGHS
ncbi:lipase secretion chaperone [Chitinimonas koreensis]|uniref:lipase secretion chaperone n=1 Tax=Chitinimonas koreensis TaxID=356302 RepID=UPI0004146D63|nr:lipase secretion chaperone [Chitinimonas koreensis]QNM96661.1 hypothetical protein H9L41_23425 [Chitinimonas koreensis]